MTVSIKNYLRFDLFGHLCKAFNDFETCKMMFLMKEFLTYLVISGNFEPSYKVTKIKL